MTKHVSMIALILALSLSAFAQRPGGGQGQGQGQGRGMRMTEEDVKRRVANLSETLEMTNEQHDKVLKFELELYTKMQVEMEKNMGNREAMRSAMMKIRDERDTKYSEVLTEDQMTKLREIQEQRRSQMRQQRETRDGEGSASDRPARGRGRN